MSLEIVQHPHLRDSRRDWMLEPEEVSRIMELHRLGLGSRQIAGELGLARNTIKRYLKAGGYAPYQSPRRPCLLDGLEEWLRATFLQHRGNCDVVRQQLLAEHGRVVSLRTIQRNCQGLRAELRARAKATVRFETPPGKQLQIDFGEATVEIGGHKTRVHLFVATLGYSRRGYVVAFRHERQSAWFAGMEGAFVHFGGIPQEVLLDNAKALVVSHNPETREVVFNDRFHAFARHWGFVPKACAPYRARTKGKDENGVGYVKKNALAGHRFPNWEAFEAHLDRWQREISDERVHGTTKEAPRLRFDRDERMALTSLGGRPPYSPARELSRVVNVEACVEVDTNRYSVPWRFIGETVTVLSDATSVTVSHAGRPIARHALLAGTRQRSIDPAHFDGLVVRTGKPGNREESIAPPQADLARPLSEYEALAGGGF